MSVRYAVRLLDLCSKHSASAGVILPDIELFFIPERIPAHGGIAIQRRGHRRQAVALIVPKGGSRIRPADVNPHLIGKGNDVPVGMLGDLRSPRVLPAACRTIKRLAGIVCDGIGDLIVHNADKADGFIIQSGRIRGRAAVNKYAGFYEIKLVLDFRTGAIGYSGQAIRLARGRFDRGDGVQQAGLCLITVKKGYLYIPLTAVLLICKLNISAGRFGNPIDFTLRIIPNRHTVAILVFLP